MSGQLPAPGRPLVVETSLKTAEGDSLVLEWWRLSVIAGGDQQVPVGQIGSRFGTRVGPTGTRVRPTGTRVGPTGTRFGPRVGPTTGTYRGWTKG